MLPPRRDGFQLRTVPIVPTLGDVANAPGPVDELGDVRTEARLYPPSVTPESVLASPSPGAAGTGRPAGRRSDCPRPIELAPLRARPGRGRRSSDGAADPSRRGRKWP